jgi:hypothetical protein
MECEQCHWTPESGWAPSFQGRLSKSAQVVFMFGATEALQPADALATARRWYPNAVLFGCSTGGEIHGARVRDKSVTLTAVAFSHGHVATAQSRIPGVSQSFEAGARLVGSFDPAGLRHVFVLSEGLKVNSSDLVDGVNSALRPGVTASGGFAADCFRFQATATWCDSPPQQSSAVALGFYGDRFRVGMAATAGWDTFGLDRLITKSHKNVLYEFDGRPALALYKKYLGEAAVDLPSTGLLYPLGLRVGAVEDRVLRTILSIDEAEQSITFAGNVPEGSYARLMRGNIEHLIDAAAVAAKSSAAALGGAASQLAILVSCNGRRPVLKQRIEEEVEAAQEVLGEQATITGFYSYGEICPVGDGPSQLHNETMTIASFAEV